MNMFIKARELFEKDYQTSQEVNHYNASMQGGKTKATKSQNKLRRNPFKK
ncbi:hypothetical protein GLW08_19150 [Pontibacillus yanchengensis]|uniref:Uncharacterized protein n=2 Tax=Pontibacillus yanchengensis TaxID=462910 RepID=A0ACC7VM91_9BACI|nr:hypothetical protein [Pontibacillus yanchengensis]MYL33668.1 hypothetical protein [Pontibacillus yanchengensis]MYL55435.1 hypothetical protein [Pontibacillus yanchengensis]